MPATSARRSLAAVLGAGALAALLAGCGGGSGGSPTDPGGAGPSPAQVESQSFELMNQARASEGVQPQLAFDPQLAAIARAYSEAMRDRGFFSHVDPEGHDFVFRLEQAGVAFTAAAENLALVTNAGDPARFAHDHFLQNPEHRVNILDRRLTHAGVGVTRQGSTYWVTQLFVRR